MVNLGVEQRSPEEIQDFASRMMQHPFEDEGEMVREELPEGEGAQVIHAERPSRQPLYAMVYHRETGEALTIHASQKKFCLEEAVLSDGSPAFSEQPVTLPGRTYLKCLLHAQDPNRAEWDRMGLPTCILDNISTIYDQRRHMEIKHPTAWAAIQERNRLEEQDKWAQRDIEDRQFRREEATQMRELVQAIAKPPHTCDFGPRAKPGARCLVPGCSLTMPIPEPEVPAATTVPPPDPAPNAE